MHLDNVSLVLLEVVVIIALSRLMGFACRSIKQPLVIGEIIAGIMLGPSLFGLIAPELAASLFPLQTLPALNVLSQVGLIFFMFLIGLELDPKYLKGNIEIAMLASHVSILAPFALATVSSLILYPLVSNATVSFTAFALFLGSALSITAFPVLSRIITENNLQTTRLGALALTCAAVDDVTAWCLLALAIAVTRSNSFIGALPTIGLSLLYIGLMLTVGRWFLQRFSKLYKRTGRLNQFALAAIYMGVVVSALITDIIGIHLIFGAFLIGAIMPKEPGLVREIAQKTEDFVLIFLLPIFFAYSGLKTQVGLLNQPDLWLLCALVLAVAIFGKYVGTYIAARVSGIDKREASALGWLMNTRGLTELIVLNIGLDLGVISPLLFTMLVIMALVTTFMTSPLLEWTYPKRLIKLDTVGEEVVREATAPIKPTYRIIVPVANPRTQKGLLQLAGAIAGTKLQPAIVYPLSLIELEEAYLFKTTPGEADRLITQQTQGLSELISTLEPPSIRTIMSPIVQVSSDVVRAIGEITRQNPTDLVLLGWHRPIFDQNRLGGRVGQILTQAKVDVAVFVDRRLNRVQRILVPYANSIHDDLGLELAIRLLVDDESRQLQILQVTLPGESASELSAEVESFWEELPINVRDRVQFPIIEATDPIKALIEASAGVDLTIAGTSRSWGIERQTLGRYTDRLAVECHSSLLITRRYSQVTSHMASVLASETAQKDLEQVTTHEEI
ncbi:cation:proton antiporter domain-containing protein [Merismopedia glauca]|uniref:Sodium:proton antiporter n=1 Tax=Merismopedia glauca CCAP 1448/3 TaxID=1296344 RepID=A0A2T1C1K5_9CYAN|nr:cation:proton antiporter [Merismopedia glauca]PSB02165.1 sodium:proton antiporter [Merismopedia glauca CCAP 1448/3]